jgi:hypothetical protein
MKVFYFSIFIILISIMIIPDVLADHDSAKQWGTIKVDKPTIELPYTSDWNPTYEKIKIFGTVEEPRSAGSIFMTVTEPDGKIYPIKTRPNTTTGTFETVLVICCNEFGTYSVYAEWREYHIGTVTFDVVSNSPTVESVDIIPDWIKTHAEWWANGQISDRTYLLGIEYLVKEGVIITEQTGDSDFTSPGSPKIPKWIKANAEWWSNGQISDIAYVSGIQHLIKVGIIKVFD